jgi:hypothetical protein
MMEESYVYLLLFLLGWWILSQVTTSMVSPLSLLSSPQQPPTLPPQPVHRSVLSESFAIQSKPIMYRINRIYATGKQHIRIQIEGKWKFGNGTRKDYDQDDQGNSVISWESLPEHHIGVVISSGTSLDNRVFGLVKSASIFHEFVIDADGFHIPFTATTVGSSVTSRDYESVMNTNGITPGDKTASLLSFPPLLVVVPIATPSSAIAQRLIDWAL